MTRVLTLAVLAGVAQTSVAQMIDGTIAQPNLDRWMYPFNGTPGSKLDAPTFGAPGIPGFDDLDSQFIFGFDTTALVEAGLGSYRIGAVVVTTTNGEGVPFAYDDSYDSYTTYLDEADPDYSVDEDAGRPVTLYAVGYRGGFDVTTFEETSDFGFDPIDPGNFSGIRNAFAALFDDEEAAFDVSMHVTERYEADPIGIGVTDAVEPGEEVFADTTFTYEIDLCAPGVREYVQAGLDVGQLNFAATSLHGATQQDPGAFPRWYTKENPLALPPFAGTATLTLVVIAGDYADFNGDGVKNILDFVTFQQAFVAGSLLADANGDCELNVLDFVAFQVAFGGG